MEYASHGNLRNYLRCHRVSTSSSSSSSSSSSAAAAAAAGRDGRLSLHHFSVQVSAGMQHLAAMNVRSHTYLLTYLLTYSDCLRCNLQLQSHTSGNVACIILTTMFTSHELESACGVWFDLSHPKWRTWSILSLSSRPLCSLWHYWSQHIAYSSVILVWHSGLRFRLV